MMQPAAGHNAQAAAEKTCRGRKNRQARSAVNRDSIEITAWAKWQCLNALQPISIYCTVFFVGCQDALGVKLHFGQKGTGKRQGGAEEAAEGVKYRADGLLLMDKAEGREYNRKVGKHPVDRKDCLIMRKRGGTNEEVHCTADAAGFILGDGAV